MKFTRTLLAISVLSTAQLVSAQGNKPDTLVQQLLDTHYPDNQKALEAFNKSRNAEEAINNVISGMIKNGTIKKESSQVIAWILLARRWLILHKAGGATSFFRREPESRTRDVRSGQPVCV